MIILAQTGLAGGAAAAAIFCIVVGLFVGLGPVFLLLLWYTPEILQFLIDTVRGRDLLAETERDLVLEGRLFDPRHKDRFFQRVI